MKVAVVKDHFDVMSSGDVEVAVTRATITSTLASAPVQFNVKREVRQLPLTIHFNGNGGTPERETTDAIVGGKIGELPLATRGTWLFDGWYTAATGGTLVTADTIVSSSIENLYAHWIEAVTVTFDPNGGTLTGATTILAYIGKPLNESGVAFPTATGPIEKPSSIGWFTDATSGTKITPTTVYDGSYTTIYPHYAAQSYTVDLNGQWYLMDDSSVITDPDGNTSPFQTNPDSTNLDGVYASYSNWHKSNQFACMRISFVGYSTFKFYIRSYAESNYDYVVVGNTDVAITSNPDYSGKPYHTRGNQKSGQTLSDYTQCEIQTDGGSHFVDVVYRKDSSADSGNDRGYVLIKGN